MDRYYLRATMERIEKEKAEHGQKFGSHPAHQNCLPNFDNAISKLQAELDKLEREHPHVEVEAAAGG